MSAQQLPEREKLPSGKVISREFSGDGSIIKESHGYGLLEIMIDFVFRDGVKTDEMYFVKRRLVSRRSYEKARCAYPDMPPADATVEDLGGLLLQGARQQQRRKKKESDLRLAASAESRFPRPTSTNWIRVISGDKAHLMIFSSRDWKLLLREPGIPMGKHWLRSFGFNGPPGALVAQGFQVGYEVVGDKKAMLDDSKALLPQVVAFASDPMPSSYFHSSIRPRKVPRKHTLAWPTALPPLIEFLSGIDEPKVTIYNHHR